MYLRLKSNLRLTYMLFNQQFNTGSPNLLLVH